MWTSILLIFMNVCLLELHALMSKITYLRTYICKYAALDMGNGSAFIRYMCVWLTVRKRNGICAHCEYDSMLVWWIWDDEVEALHTAQTN